MDKAPKKKKRMVLKGASAQPIKDGKIVSTVDDILDQITSKLTEFADTSLSIAFDLASRRVFEGIGFTAVVLTLGMCRLRSET